MNIFDKLKEFGKKQSNQINPDEYNQTKDRELMNLRRTRREQLERLEKERLKDEVKKHNQRELIAYNQGKKLKEVNMQEEQPEEGIIKNVVIHSKPKVDYSKFKKNISKTSSKLKQEMYSKTKSQIKNIKKKAKKQYKTEWTMKPSKEKEPENASFMYQNFFRPSNPDLERRELNKNSFFR